MSVSRGANLQDSARASLASQRDETRRQSILKPFCEDLNIDKELQLSKENFRETIYGFYADRNVTPLSQLTAPPPFPTPHVLAQFATKTYTDYKKRETDTQYETRLALPDGWKLLTTASNGGKTNGYFGAAYWHPEHQQVVIAHRGTQLTQIGALWADVAGVVLKHHVPQMSSASTFAHKVVEVLRVVSKLKGVSFQLFFTGHSLGGWLAQVTTFATRYLKAGENILFRSNDRDCYHPHTVVFDSPGCKDMLSDMRDQFDVRLDGRSIDIEHLDITSYLSAPNRINTCNVHLGTVYRIFTDMSDMGWWEKNTALYNLAAHSMDKIVEAFDPVTGQVYKNEEGQLKVQLVVDWPINAGLNRGKNYRSFFEWARNLNNYHPDIQDVSLDDLCLIRYQTKNYDERENRLNIFSEEEQEFLQCYLKLRQWSGFCKPKELFAVMENDQAKDQAEKMLQNFEIESETVRCKDATELQDLISYVKRLLQLFPEITEFGNRIYQRETSSCIKQMKQSPLDFNPNAMNISEFVENKQQQVLQLQMDDGDEWTGLVKVYQVLQKTDCLKEGRYTVLKLERLVTLNMLMDFRTLILSVKAPYLILVACETNQLLKAETIDMVSTFFEIMKQKPFIKIIFTTRSEDRATPSLQDISRDTFGDAFVTKVERLNWCGLTSSSQEQLLKNSVKFQDANISLQEIMSAESTATKFLPLVALLEAKELTIADPVPISSGYNEGYYIGRTFRYQKTIKQDIFKDKEVRDSHVYLARSEEIYTKLCQLHPTNNVHWIEKDKSGKLVLQQSKGNLETVRRYIDTDSSHTYDVDKLLEQAEHQRVMLISDIAGMGKSTVLTHLSKQIKEKFPAKWVVRINLNDHTEALKELKQKQIDKEKAIEFVSEKVLKLKLGLELELFKKCCEQKQKVRIVIMLDGFDEISPFYKETVIDLLQALRQTAVEQLWVTTRPHLRKELEDKLQQLSYTLAPFSEEDQVEFLTKFWSVKHWFTERKEEGKEREKNNLKVYAEHLIKKLAESLRDIERGLTVIPLQTRMLAEAFDKDVKLFYESAEPTPKLPSKLDLIELYGRFIERKYDIYQEDKFQVHVNTMYAKEQKERDLRYMRNDHQLLALKMLFTEEQVALFQNNTERLFSNEELTRIGIVQLSHDGKPQFIHRTFAEYYVADCLVSRLTERKKYSQQVQNSILKDIFLEKGYEEIRLFVDGLLSKITPSAEVLKQNGNWTHDLEEDIFHKATSEDNANIMGFLLDIVQAGDQRYTVNELLLGTDEGGLTAWHIAIPSKSTKVLEKLTVLAEENLTAEEIYNKLLLATDYEGRTVWHLAAMWDNTETLQKVWEWTKENATTQEMINKLLIGTDNEGRTAWHLAAMRGNSKTLQKVWECVEKNLTREEIINKLLVGTDNEGRTVLQLAAMGGNSDTLQKVWERAQEKLTTDEINNKLLLSTDKKGRTVLQLAAMKGNSETLQKVWEWVKENLTDEINNKLLIGKDSEGRNVLQLAAMRGNSHTLQKVWEWAKEKPTTDKINNQLLIGTDNEGRTAWHLAVQKGNLEILQKVWEWAKENLTTEEVNNKLLLGTDNEGRTAWHVAAMWYNSETLQKVWDWAKENLTREEINNKLLLGTDNEGRNTWHLAAMWDNSQTSQKVWEWTKENLTKGEIINKFLKDTDKEGRTAWHLAAMWGNSETSQKVWEWAKENLTTKEIVNKLLMDTDNEGRTAWHLAAMWGNSETLQKVWEWAKDDLTTEEIINNLFIGTDNEGRTAWHLAAMRGNSETLQKLWDWAKEKLTTDEINNKFLIGTDKEGKTAWHLAAMSGNSETLQKVWEWAKEKLTTGEINNKLLMGTDKEGKLAWHLAALSGNSETLQKVWEWAKENLTREEIINKLLIVTDKEGRTAWQLAEMWGNSETLHKVWEWAKENLTREEIINKLLIVTDKEGRTAWQLAEMWGNSETLQKVWEWAKENNGGNK